MADKSQPSKNGKATTAPKGDKLSRAQIPRALLLGTKSQPQFNTASGGRMFSAKLKPSTASEGTGPMKAKVAVPCAPKRAGIKPLDDAYDSYLLNFVNLALMEDLEKLQELNHLETEVSKIFDVVSCASDTAKAYADRIIIKIWDHIKLLDTIKGSFNNIIDFVGEETLMEIQTILVRKYGRITVDGAAAEESLFRDVELKKVLEVLRNNLTGKQDKHKISGFIQLFGEALRNLSAMAQITEKQNKDLQTENKIALEHCSQSICNSAREKFLAKEEGGKGEEAKENGGRDLKEKAPEEIGEHEKNT